MSPGGADTLNTPRVIVDEGLDYWDEYKNDDQPFPIRIGDKRTVCVPMSSELSDYNLFMRMHYTTDEVFTAMKDEFDLFYEGGVKNAMVMNIIVHPQVFGQPFRIQALSRILEYISGFKDVWFPTRLEIAQSYLKQLDD